MEAYESSGRILNIVFWILLLALVVFIIVKAFIKSKTPYRANAGGDSMKKMIFGGLLFFSGFLGFLAFTVAAAVDPIVYNDETGLISTLTAMGVIIPYAITCIMAIAGIVICVLEVYGRKQ